MSQLYQSSLMMTTTSSTSLSEYSEYIINNSFVVKPHDLNSVYSTYALLLVKSIHRRLCNCIQEQNLAAGVRPKW